MLAPTDPSPPSAAPPDLTIYSEATRRTIYDQVVRDSFTRRLIEDDWYDPPCTADEAELQVHFLFGRWLVTYWDREVPDSAPEKQRRELLLVEPAPGTPEELIFQEI